MVSTTDTLDLTLWQEVLDALPNPVTLNKKMIGDDGIVYNATLFVNKAFRDIIGYSKEEIPTDREWLKQAYPEQAYQKFVVEKCFNMVENEHDLGLKSPGFPTKVFCKDGIERWFQVSSNADALISEKYQTVVFTEVQTPENTILQLQAVTQLLKNKNSALQESEAKLANQYKLLQKIVDTVPTRIFWKDQNGAYLGANNLFLHDAQLSSQDQILGKTDFELPWGKTEAAAYRKDDLVVMESGQEKLLFEESQTNETGDTIVLLTSKVPLQDTNGDTVGILGVYVDITEQRKVENDLREQRLAKEAADLSNQSKSAFLANISHELRTPMHGILSFVDIGSRNAERLTPEKNIEYFGHIKTCADRLLMLINDLLDLSKLEAGKMAMSCMQNSLEKVALECIAEQSARLLEQDKKVTWHPDSISGDGIFDSERIAQVITNLLSNAIKITPTGKNIDFLIEHTELDNTNGHKIPALLFSARDYGVGIPEGEFELIFEKFSESSATKKNVGGTGLGLPICKEIITAHSGKVWVENHSEAGAVFKFVIPVIQRNK
ncbi:MAG: PAS domain-containing sensor histidine kinase [Gammaproteobacteria bacterium]|nr:PAS domain-containing sensor histidine kinase [Gammaproteobacteria bacterium]